MRVSTLVLKRRKILAEKFFETTHMAFYKYPDGEILTLVENEMRVAPLGIAGVSPPFPRWLMVEDEEIVSDLWSVPLKGVCFYDPSIKTFNVPLSSQRYREILEEKAKESFQTIIRHIKNGEFEKIAGLGPGLTPLGDDILSGLIIAGVKVTLRGIRTSEISMQQMKHAFEGYVPLPVKVFLESARDSLLLDMGETSGAGWAFGITYVLEGSRW